MIGAIAGDIIGSVYERIRGENKMKSKDFPLFSPGSCFTDDTVLTVASADVLINQDKHYASAYRSWYRQYPNRGFGGMFRKWASSDSEKPYNSFGNGSAMRIAPIAWAFCTEDKVLAEAKRSAECTHNHPEGIKGAQAVALAIFLARQGWAQIAIRHRVQTLFGYDMNRLVDECREGYRFDSTCQGSVPEAIICACQSQDWEDAVRNAISLGGDTDTQACIAGSIAEAIYGGVPPEIVVEVQARLDQNTWKVVDAFSKRFVHYGVKP